MNFLNPLFLLGMLAVAVPLVIHLINLRRPRKLSFPTLVFFEELKKSTIRRIRIKQYLLLALRMAAVLMLALALARPLLAPSMGGDTNAEDPRIVAVLVDNSPSMSRIGSGGPFFEQARHIARQIVEGSMDEDRYWVSGTNGARFNNQLVSSSRALELLDELQLSNTPNGIARSIQNISAQFQNSSMQQAVIYLVTDLQKSQMDELEDLEIPGIGGSRKIGLQLVNVGSADQPNLAVSKLELQSRMLSKGNPVTLRAEVKNFGDVEAANQFASVEVGGRLVGQYELNLAPGESQQLLFEVVPPEVGDLAGKIVLEGDEVTFDNDRYFVVSIPRNRTVLLVNQNRSEASEFISYLQPALEAARRSNTQIEFTRLEPSEIRNTNWERYDVVILDGLKEIPEYWFDELQQYVQEGRGLMFFPSEQGDIQNYNSFLGLFNAGRFAGIEGEYASFTPVTRLDGLAEGHPILEEIFVREEGEKIQVDLPELFYYYRLERGGGTGSYPILTTSGGDDILMEQRFGEGRFLVSALGNDPGWSNFPVNALFAPVYYRAVLYASASEQGGLSTYEFGKEFVWSGPLEATEIELRLGGASYRPEVQTVPQGVRIRYSPEEWEPGILRIHAGGEKGEERLVAVNQQVAESDFSTLTEEELDKYLENSVTVTGILNTNELSEENLATRLQAASMGREIWNWFIWLALILLVAETLISKLYRAESIS